MGVEEPMLSCIHRRDNTDLRRVTVRDGDCIWTVVNEPGEWGGRCSVYLVLDNALQSLLLGKEKGGARLVRFI